MSAFERTGARPIGLVNWHLTHGLHCRVAGVQLLLLEYHQGVPIAVIDYRRYEDGVPNTDHPIYRSISALCGTLPFFITYYDRRTWGFYVTGINLPARRLVDANPLLSEADYVDWLHWLRGGAPRRPDFPRGLGRTAPSAKPDQPMPVPGLLTLDGATWPGEEISRRHRFWGPNCPAVDLDFLLIDSHDAEPRALVEYKHLRAREIAWQRDRNILAQRHFASDTVPFLVVRYVETPWKFQLDHDPATGVQNDTEMMDGHVWADRLRAMRGAEIRRNAL